MKTISKINPVSAGTVSAVITMAVMLFVFVPIFLLVGFSGLISESDLGIFGGSIVMIFIVPLFYGAFSFIIGLVSAFVYNATYKFHGGIKLAFADNPEAISEIGKS